MLPSFISFTFGSFGDIVTVIQLLRDVVKVLGDSKGASLDYQKLVEELRGYEDVLVEVHDTLSDSRTPVRVARALRKEVDLCNAIITRINRDIIKYRESLRRGGSKRMMIDSWRKIGWTLFRGPEVDQVRQELASCAQRMTASISLSTKYVHPCTYLPGHFLRIYTPEL